MKIEKKTDITNINGREMELTGLINQLIGCQPKKKKRVDDNIQVPHDLTIHQDRRTSIFWWKVDNLCLEPAEMAERHVEGTKAQRSRVD